uniref:NSP1 n=1 Tax=Pacific black duck rotavirus G TaxID=2798292 RepID=A0A7T4V7I0_9REOV|nr:NSP1 [Pacific black duck rotavirus G]
MELNCVADVVPVSSKWTYRAYLDRLEINEENKAQILWWDHELASKYLNPHDESKLLLSRVCDRKGDHFCGHAHVPEQWNNYWNRPAMPTRHHILWPCGLKSAVISGVKVVASEFVTCKCGNARPTRIEGESYTFLVVCANDFLMVEGAGKADALCENCGARCDYFRASKGMVQDMEKKVYDEILCLKCSPVKRIFKLACKFARAKTITPSYEHMKLFYDYGKAMENRAESAFKEMNVKCIVSGTRKFVLQASEWSMECLLNRAKTLNRQVKSYEVKEEKGKYFLVVYKEYGRVVVEMEDPREAKNWFRNIADV